MKFNALKKQAKENEASSSKRITDLEKDRAVVNEKL